MKLVDRLNSILASNDPNSVLYSFSSLASYIEDQVNALKVAENDIVLEELKKVAENVLSNYIRVGLDFSGVKNAKDLINRVNAIIEANMDDFLQIDNRVTAFGIDFERGMIKLSILKEIITLFSASLGLSKEPDMVPLIYAGGVYQTENLEEVRKLREAIEKERNFLMA